MFYWVALHFHPDDGWAGDVEDAVWAAPFRGEGLACSRGRSDEYFLARCICGGRRTVTWKPLLPIAVLVMGGTLAPALDSLEARRWVPLCRWQLSRSRQVVPQQQLAGGVPGGGVAARPQRE